MPHRITVLPATRQRWHSCPYPSRCWYSIKRPRTDARLSWPRSQGSVATHLRYGGIFNTNVFTNLLLSLPVKFLFTRLQMTYIWRGYRQGRLPHAVCVLGLQAAERWRIHQTSWAQRETAVVNRCCPDFKLCYECTTVLCWRTTNIVENTNKITPVVKVF